MVETMFCFLGFVMTLSAALLMIYEISKLNGGGIILTAIVYLSWMGLIGLSRTWSF